MAREHVTVGVAERIAVKAPGIAALRAGDEATATCAAVVKEGEARFMAGKPCRLCWAIGHRTGSNPSTTNPCSTPPNRGSPE